MRWPILLPSLSLLLPRLATAIIGHGPKGIHPITDRYIAVVDSSIDAILIVDGQTGGAVVGHVVLHDSANDENVEKWLNPLSVATCDACKHIFVTNENMLFAVALDKPLKEMADSHDFSSLIKGVVRPFWPKGWPSEYSGDGGLRAVSIASDGSSGYVGHAGAGIFSFDPLNPTDKDEGARQVISTGDVKIGKGITGLHHTSTMRNLIVTRERTVHIVKIRDDDGSNPLESGYPEAYELALDYHCDYLYSDDDSVIMRFLDTVVINDYAFVMGHPTHSTKAMHNGVAIYRLTWNEDEEAWHNCIQVAGDGLLEAGWVDGIGRASRFSNTARDMAILPHSKSHIVVVADVDNRALRYVDVTIPVESQDDKLAHKVMVSTVAYDEDLYQVLYAKEEPWTKLTPESVMNQDGKSYYHSGEGSLYSMTLVDAQDECSRVGLGRVCTLPEIRARFSRGQYPTIKPSDGEWTTVWTAEGCSSCHLESPGRCPLTGGEDDENDWGSNVKMIATFSPRMGLQTQCVPIDVPVDTFSMCCGIGGPAVLSSQAAKEAQKKAGISFGVIIPLLFIAAAAYGVYIRKRAKPSWWPKFLRRDSREETGHAPHREVDLRGRDYI
ncbi:hypothetical protein ACHAXA_003893 [Cyclostephanos tholiformis]|uniref:Uncharacterized protein n=1 Tax=Cyclostephanos tholiformis TaxID=382380 RepID=A0ABD3R746_9STRA